jgi:cytochrome c556
MKGYLRHFLGAGLAVAVIGAGIATATPAFADAVKDRVAAMKDMGKINKALTTAAKKGDKAAAEKQAMMIVAVAEKLPGLFPKGTDRKALGEKATRAKPEIWAKWDEFKAASEKLKSTAMQVASAAKGGDLAMAAKGMGAACGGCHKVFRGDKAK